jgi:Ca2+-binding RTX toxin-like protein
MAGQGNDSPYGNAGADTLVAGGGNDDCRGGSGIDTALGCESQTGIP